MASKFFSKMQQVLPIGSSRPDATSKSYQQDQNTRSPAYDTKSEKEESLTTVLRTHVDRTNLLLLVSDCTEAMRLRLLDTFDPAEVASPPKRAVPSAHSAEPLFQADTSDADDVGENGHEYTALVAPDVQSDAMETIATDSKSPMERAQSTNLDDMQSVLDQDPGTDQDAMAQVGNPEFDTKTQEQRAKAAAEKKRKEYEARTKECDSIAMTDLKVAALSYFENWRDRVIERVGEAVNSQTSNEPDDALLDQDASQVAGENTTQAAEEQSLPLPQDEEATQEAVHELYPPQQTLLTKLRTEQRILILHSLLLLLLGLESYQSQSRVLLLHVAASLELPVSVLSADEASVARGLLEAASKQMSADEETRKRTEENAIARRWKVGLGAVAGAVLIGVTGGLAAPLLAAGIGSVMGGLGLGATAAATYLGALAGSAPLIGALFGAYGGRMTGQMVDSYAKEISDFSFMPIHQSEQRPGDVVQEGHRLRVAIGVSGWLTEEAEIVKPWKVLSDAAVESFALRWEVEALMNLGNSISTYVSSAAWGLAQREIIRHTVFAAFAAAMWPIAAVKASRVIDNPFSVAKSRSEKAGTVLADALSNKIQGERPVTLVGYGLGATVIVSCLESLAQRKQFGLIENVIIAGAPAPSASASWRRLRSVVAGRLVNVYSANDYLLGFLYRASSLQLGVAGLQPISSVSGVESVDASDIVDGHLKYRFLTGSVLKLVGFEDADLAEVERQEHQLQQQEKDLAEERSKHTAANSGPIEEDDVLAMEKEVEKRNRASGFFGAMTNAMQTMSDSVTSLGKDKKRASPAAVEEKSVAGSRGRDPSHAE